MNAVSIGRIVLYRLSDADAQAINRRRTDGESIKERMQERTWPAGAQAHIGSYASSDVYVPMIVVSVWPNEYGEGIPGVNGQAFLDGNDCLWITSARQGTEQGQWMWPRGCGRSASSERVGLLARCEGRR